MTDHSLTAWLTAAELLQLTERRQPAAQRRALDRMGIRYRPNAAGRPLVERRAVLQYAGGSPKQRTQPNWDALKTG